MSGGGHLPQAAFANTCVEIAGTPDTYHWKSDAGNDLLLGYCPNCGSPIYKITSKLPVMLFVAVGLLNDHALFQSPHQAFAEGCQVWDAQGK
ncbi:GFA family protein [Yoonia sp. SDW83-1]|uniref:GFA family protein n=1 Tax=Yoonia sp. SDW83-1 TaxID=3366945 RepID=UPI00398C68DF